jgi:acid phosphatase
MVAVLVGVGCSEPPADADSLSGRRTHESLDATLWRQTAAESRALAIQTYAMAVRQLDVALADRTWTASLEQERMAADGIDLVALPPAVIVDLDETVLDNTPYAARLVRSGGPHVEGLWDEWCDEGAAEAIPGALEFVRRTEEKGITPFFVTNRRMRCEEATRRNLLDLGIDPGPEGDDRVLMRDELDSGRDKTSRRELVAAGHRVLLMIGDDLGDFVDVADLTVEERSALVEEHAARWGRSWIVLPNPIYGSWRRALLGYEGLPDEEALRRLHDALRTGQIEPVGP